MANGVDAAGNFHDPNTGQFVSITTLFERERLEHLKDHEQEYLVAQATARRLEREVEQTAMRLERLVEETALRLEKGVSTALEAVAKTAQVHSEAHNREHQAHERIHSVEKIQVDKAEQQMNKRLEGMNEFRSALQDQATRMTPREMFEQRVSAVDTRLQGIERIIVGREAFAAALDARDKQLAQLENFRSKALGFGALLSLLSGVVGAIIMRAIGS